MILRLVFIFTALSTTSTAFAEESLPDVQEIRRAKYYSLGKTNEDFIYQQTTTIDTKASGERIWNSEARDDQGELVFSEWAQLIDNRVVKQKISNYQMHETSEIEVGKDKVSYKTYKFFNGQRGELLEEKIRTKEDNFMTGPPIEFYLQQRWDILTSGKTVEVEFGIFEIMRSVSFDLSKEGETEQVLKVKMKPSNFFIALILDAIHLEFDKVTKRLVHYRGRTPLRRLKDGKLKTWDAEVIYELK